MDSDITFSILVLLCAALFWYLVGVRGDEGKPSETLRKRIMAEALNAAEIARLEIKLAEVDPEWRRRFTT